MMEGVETPLDGTTLIVRIPMRFQRRGGRKRIVAPDGSAIVPATNPQPGDTLAQALARTSRLDDGVYTGLSKLADAERIKAAGWRGPHRLCRSRRTVVRHIMVAH